MDPHRWREIRAVFNELVELEPGQRAERLAALSIGDPDLGDAVEALLAADADSSGGLGGAALPPRGERTGAPSDPLGLAGRTLSHFRVLEPLEAGGMGVVYRAEDTRLGRAVALKFLLPHHTLDPAAKQRFLQEARTAGALDHPNLCTIYGVGESEDGRLFLAMPLYPGETLRARLQRDGALPVAEALAIARQIAQGLACAHAAGIVHRDLKPGNLMLLPDGTTKILDFGVAKARELELTRSGSRLGTVSYMAPEQVRGEAVDARADLWALGVVLYEMLTGRRPFPGEHETAIAHAVVHAEPEPPSALRADLPAAVEELVLSALQKDPAGRHASAPEMLEELSGIPAAGAPASRRGWHSLRRRTKRAAARWLVLGGAVLAVGGGLATRPLWEAGAGHPEVERSVAVLPFTNLSESRDNEYFSDGITEEILTTLAGIGELRVISRSSAMRYKGSDKPLRQIASELGVAHVLEGSVQRAGDRVRISAQLIDATKDRQLWARRYDRPLQDVFAVQSEIAREIARALQAHVSAAEQVRLERSGTVDLTAYDYLLQARQIARRATMSDIETALSLVRRARQLDPSYPDVHVSLSSLFAGMYLYKADRAFLDSAVVSARQAITLDPNLAAGHARLGTALNLLGDRDGSLEANLRAVQLDPNHSDGLANLYHFDFGRIDEAARLRVGALVRDPTSVNGLEVMARLYLHLGMPERARPLYERSIEFNPEYVPSQWGPFASLVAEGRIEDAQAFLQRRLDANGTDRGALLMAAQIAVHMGDLSAARVYADRLDDPSGGGRGGAWVDLVRAWILRQSGDTDRALTLARHAAAEMQRFWGSPPTRPEAFADLARLHVVEGKPEEAVRLMEEAVRRGWRLIHDRPLDPVLNSLKGHPRYDRLMAEVRADVDRMRARVEREGW